MKVYAFLSIFIELNWFQLISMEFYRYLLISMDFYKYILISMNFYGFPRISVNFYGWYFNGCQNINGSSSVYAPTHYTYVHCTYCNIPTQLELSEVKLGRVCDNFNLFIARYTSSQGAAPLYHQYLGGQAGQLVASWPLQPAPTTGRSSSCWLSW